MGHHTSSTEQIIKAASACVWRGDHVLLAQRGKAWGRGLWSLPGGRVEEGETDVAAATRELLEETGVTAEFTQHIGTFELRGPKAHYVISCWLGIYRAGQASAASDAMDVRWVALHEMSGLQLAPHTAEAIHMGRALLHNS